MDEIKQALMDPNVSFHFVYAFGVGRGVQVRVKSRKVGPILFPGEGQGLTEVLSILGGLLDGKTEEVKSDG